MGVVVTFNYGQWIQRYPEFSAVTQPIAQNYFNEATLTHRNDGIGRGPTDPNQQLMLLNMLTAHIAKLNAPDPDTGEPPSPLVGRISSASQGSVNVSVENNYPPGTPQWFQQTPYGSAYWAATAVYRTMFYRRGPHRTFDPPPFGSW